MEISNENLQVIEKNVLSIQDELYKYYTDEEMYRVMELTKNKKVFLKCMENVYIPYLVEKVKNPETSQEMILKLTAHPKGMIQLSILAREDTNTQILKLLLENFKEEKNKPNRHVIINHKKMDEQTLYELTECDNNEILSLIILSDKVSSRILEKLQQSKDEEIKIMAKVRDPKTNPEYIKKVIKKEIPKTLRVTGDYINKFLPEHESLLINDILEAAIRNPKLPSELVDMYKGFCKTIALLYVIPHPNVSQKRLDTYYRLGDDDVKKAVEKARSKKVDAENKNRTIFI